MHAAARNGQILAAFRRCNGAPGACLSGVVRPVLSVVSILWFALRVARGKLPGMSPKSTHPMSSWTRRPGAAIWSLTGRWTPTLPTTATRCSHPSCSRTLPVDPQARHTRKTSAHKRDGYKAHIAAEPETGLVTECALTAANVADGPTGVGLLAEEDPGLEVLADSAYGGGQTRAALRAAGHVQTIKPLPLSSAVPGGFTSTTSASTARLAQSGARRVTRPRSAPREPPASPAGASAARCAGAAPPPRLAAPSASTPRGRAARRPPPRDHMQLPGKLPALAADGGAIDRLAGRRRLPAGALPWHRAQRPVVVAAGRRGQPAPAQQALRGGPVPREGRPGRPRRPRGPSRRTRRRAGRLP